MAAPIDPKIKAAALAELATGEPLATVAKKYRIARQTLINWKDEACIYAVQTQDNRDQLGEAINAWMVKAVVVMTKQLDLAMELDWLRGHSPSELAALIAVLAEKVARVAQAQQVGQSDEGSPAPIDIRSRTG